MGCNVAKVEKIYQEVRAIARKHPECKTVDEAKIHKDVDNHQDWDWSMTAIETKALERKCRWQGI